MPHSELTEVQIAGCRAVGIPPPPDDAVLFDVGSFDWRRPGLGEHGPETPISFRWKIGKQGLMEVFCAYGWHKRAIGYGRTEKDPEWGYSLLSGPERDAAMTEIPE